jgi:hypothetical protein
MMGFESFRIELHGGSAMFPQAQEEIRVFPQVRLDQQSLPMKGSTYYVFRDGRHVIEMELRDAPVKITCRFTLCHPPSIDAVFLHWVRELMLRLGMEATICDDVGPEHRHSFSLTQFTEFSAATLDYIAMRRGEWNAAFGLEPLSATTNEVYQRIILPQCQPVVTPAEK